MKASMSHHYHALIMAGGKGERFWPWSRESRPKQLLPLVGKKTMIEMTVDRLLSVIPRDRIWIVTNASQARAMARLMPRFPKSQFIVEPVGRDSAGAVMLGCATVAKRDPDAIMALLPADHVIRDVRLYSKVLRQCFELAASNDALVTIGIKPTEPSSAYGYIERGPRAASGMYRVRRFLEKPDLPTARRLVKSGRYYWNAGMFVWSARAIEQAFRKYSKPHARGWDALQTNARAYLRRGFLDLEKISIDYAVMEKAKNIYVAVGPFDWDDVGSWTALHTHLPRDSEGNASQGENVIVDSQGCLVLGRKPIALLGVKDLLIIETEDALLISHRDSAQRVKEVVQRLPARLR